MKKFKTIALSMLALLTPLSTMALTEQEITSLTIPDVGILNLIGVLLNWFFFVLLVVAVFLLINVGYQYVVSGGASAKTTAASKTLGFILVGIVVALIAKGLVTLTCNIVGGPGTKCNFF